MFNKLVVHQKKPADVCGDLQRRYMKHTHGSTSCSSLQHTFWTIMFCFEMKMEEMNPWKRLWGIFVLEKWTHNKTNWCYWNLRMMTGSSVWSDPPTTRPSPTRWAISGNQNGSSGDVTGEGWQRLHHRNVEDFTRGARLMIQASMSTWTHFLVRRKLQTSTFEIRVFTSTLLWGMTFTT